HDSEHGRQAVIGAVDRPRDPAPTRAVPSLTPEDAVEPGSSTGHGQRRIAGGRAVPGTGAHLLDDQRMRALLLANVTQERVGDRVAGRAAIEVIHLIVLGRLA